MKSLPHKNTGSLFVIRFDLSKILETEESLVGLKCTNKRMKLDRDMYVIPCLITFKSQDEILIEYEGGYKIQESPFLIKKKGKEINHRRYRDHNTTHGSYDIKFQFINISSYD